MPSILGANTLSSGGYDVDNSLRFHSNTYLTATFGSAPTLATKNTISLWFKRSTLDTLQQLYAANSNAANIVINSNNTIAFYTNSGQLLGPRVYRDTSAWMHFVFAFDSTQGTAANRFKVYINGVLETSFNNTAYPDQNVASELGANGTTIKIGTRSNHDRIFEGYQAETAFVDGQALDATSFGEFDDSGIWKPIKISGLTFGNNGFYLEYKGTGTSANSSGIGADTSGNDLHFAVTNFAATDQSTDTCTNNFATLNPLDNFSSGATFSEGNTTVASTNSGRGIMTATFGLTSGKWYWEVKNSASGGTHSGDEWNHIGIANRPGSNTDNILAESGTGSNKVYEYTYYAYDGNHWNNGDQGGYGASFTTNDIIGVLLDLDNNKIYWSKNGAWADGSGNSDENDPNGFKAVTDPASTPGGFYFPACGDGGINVSKTWQWNFGGTPGFAVSSGNADPNGYGNFEYPTEGAYAICSKNLAEFGG